MTQIRIPELCLVTLIGVSGSGKSSFASENFLSTEVVSSDTCRAMVSDDENDQSATGDAFDLLHTIVGKRLKRGHLSVVDATSLRAEDRRSLVALAKENHVFVVAIVLNVPVAVCRERNTSRPDRQFGDHVLKNQHAALRRTLKGIRREGFRKVYVLDGVDDVESVTIERERLWTNRDDELGPFDIIGDIHGCYDELASLMSKLGWAVSGDGTDASHPDSRKLVFVGDLVDRGPASPQVLRLVMNLVGSGRAICIPGNHENKLSRALGGRKVKLSHGLAETMEQLELESEQFREEVRTFIQSLVSHAVLDGGSLVVAHAGLPATMQGRSSGAVRSFALYGDTTGETDEFGFPVRYPWAEDYRGEAAVVYGHTPTPAATWLNNTICLDTGCVFGGQLTALRWPERELVEVEAKHVYYEPVRPLVVEEPVASRSQLDLSDVTGKRIVETRLNGTVTIREENSAAALEVMSRFAIDPRWLVYLPPTMSPAGTSSREDYLEHPTEAFAAYRSDRIGKVICEEKHMGSRAVVVVCRNAEVAKRRFDIAATDAVAHAPSAGDGSGDALAGDRACGAIYTRTGRAFFAESEDEAILLDRVAAGLDRAGVWKQLDTDWLVIDAELLPWSAKAGALIRDQYASVGAAAREAVSAEAAVLAQVVERLNKESVEGSREEFDQARALSLRAEGRVSRIDAFVDAYGRYCWPTTGLEGVMIAPFQILAGEGKTYVQEQHSWHMEIADRLAEADPATFHPTRWMLVDLADPDGEQKATDWWDTMTGSGGEGMVVKPLDAIVGLKRGVAQPGVKVRGREYLRIIYGPEYTEPEQMAQLRDRRLSHKRSMAIREFSLGVEALERFVAGEPLHRVHECVFGVLALESEPIDPRL